MRREDCFAYIDGTCDALIGGVCDFPSCRFFKCIGKRKREIEEELVQLERTETREKAIKLLPKTEQEFLIRYQEMIRKRLLC